MTKKHKCHVFRCDMPARAVAKALLESHQKQTKTPPTATPTGGPPVGTGEGGKESEPTTPSQQRRGGLTVSVPYKTMYV